MPRVGSTPVLVDTAADAARAPNHDGIACGSGTPAAALTRGAIDGPSPSCFIDSSPHFYIT
ncbi:hypothetical protein AB5J72_22735 [Streptomyces sp. CG1]|uniref:hypothetical protein n=1 Tax=Streptomyces sp. CG1 TaxID=1287523 RepID=UPI0034E1A456